MIAIDGFAIDDGNEEKFWSHGLTVDHVLSILNGPVAVKRNRKGRSAPFLLIGRDASGQCIAVPIVPTHEPGIWRPLTAWPCKPSEWQALPERL